MCGLTGVLSAYLSQDHIRIFEDLMIMSTLRGREGAGIITIDEETGKGNRNNPIMTHKFTGTGAGLVTSAGYRKILTTRKKTGLVGHCRLPTRGLNSPDFIHPHVHGNIAGVHNGTLWTVDDKFVNDNQSDSSLLFRSIAQNGLQKAVDDSHGAMALVWVDNSDETLNFFRNDDRPLWLAENCHKPTTIFWASEKSFLELALSRVGYRNWIITQMPSYRHLKTPFQPGKEIEFDRIVVEKKWYSNYYNSNTEPQGWVKTDDGRQEYRTLTKEERDAGKHFEPFRRDGMGASNENASRAVELSALTKGTKYLPAIIGPGSRATGGGTGNSSAVPSRGRVTLMQKERIDKFNLRIQDGLSALEQEEARNPVIPFRGSRGSTNTTRSNVFQYSSRDDRKRAKANRKAARNLAKRDFRAGHNAGHPTYLPTRPGFYVSGGEIITIFDTGKCVYCAGREDVANYFKDHVRFVSDRDFLCSNCSDLPDAIHLCLETIPGFKDVYKRQDDPVADLFTNEPIEDKAEKLKAALANRDQVCRQTCVVSCPEGHCEYDDKIEARAILH